MDPRANVHLTCALFGNSLKKKANRVKQIFTSLLTLLLLTLRNKKQCIWRVVCTVLFKSLKCVLAYKRRDYVCKPIKSLYKLLYWRQDIIIIQQVQYTIHLQTSYSVLKLMHLTELLRYSSRFSAGRSVAWRHLKRLWIAVRWSRLAVTVAYPVFPRFLTRSIYDLSSQRISYCWLCFLKNCHRFKSKDSCLLILVSRTKNWVEYCSSTAKENITFYIMSFQ